MVSWDGRVRYWTDYLHVPLHGKSCVEVPGVHLGVHPFDSVAQGRAVWKQGDFLESSCDRVRFFAEECDRLQGFQVAVDIDTVCVEKVITRGPGTETCVCAFLLTIHGFVNVVMGRDLVEWRWTCWSIYTTSIRRGPS